MKYIDTRSFVGEKGEGARYPVHICERRRRR